MTNQDLEFFILPLAWLGSLFLTFLVAFFVGYKLDRSYELANWLGFGLGGFWLIWLLLLSAIFVLYILYGNLTIYPAIFLGVLFHKNHSRMRKVRRTEDLLSDIETFDNPYLQQEAKRIVKDPISKLETANEHTNKFAAASNSAKETLIILSGCEVGHSQTKEFRSLLRRCMKRGVMIYIGYGYQKNGDTSVKQENIKTAKMAMDALADWATKKDWEGRLEIFLHPDHSNMVIKDDDYAIVGEFDWLANTSDEKVTCRSWVISNREFVKKERDKVILGR